MRADSKPALAAQAPPSAGIRVQAASCAEEELQIRFSFGVLVPFSTFLFSVKMEIFSESKFFHRNVT